MTGSEDGLSGHDTHSLRAHDPEGSLVQVTYSGTQDRRTMMAYVEGVGFIGGWQSPHRAMPFHYLIVPINCGVLYSHSSLLPRRLNNRQVICPQCQFAFWIGDRQQEDA